MELEIINILNKSTPEEEYVLIDVLEKTDLNKFMVCDNTYDEVGDITNKHQHYYRFPSRIVEAGDRVALYTKLKYKAVDKRDDGGTTYRYNWGLNKCVWNNGGDMAHLVKISGSVPFKVKEAK